jgi:tetratricopeptide (TPR) repeat protein
VTGSAPLTKSATPGEDPQVAAAIKRAEDRLGREPGSLVFAQLADLYRKAGRLDEAITVCRTGLERYPYYTTARLILAKSLLAQGALDAAIGEVATVIEASPKEVPAHRLAADIERQRGRIDQAIVHLEAVTRLDSADREARSLLALLRADPAAADATTLMRVLRDDIFVTPSFGALCLEQGCADEAIYVFSRLLRKDPESESARAGLDAALRARSRRKG